LEVVTELLLDIGDDPVIGGCRGAEHGNVRWQRGDHVAETSVVRAEVMPPVTDAMDLVDDEKTDLGEQGGHDLPPELGVVEPFR
jgi:hypothetical protein